MARTCYYELLGVERSADDSDLKKAYRKQALIWHPDKNHGNTEEATRTFAEIKEAYETLSDPQERAWYDNHREQILRGDDYVAAAENSDCGQTNQSANVNFMSTDSLMKYFSVSSFTAFDDSPSGFYTVYCHLFEKLRDEELEIYDPDTEHMLDHLHGLSFGDSFTLYDEDAAYANTQSSPKRSSKKHSGTGTTLRDFYNFWTTFSTRKSFGWFDKFRLSDAENRQIRRLMEKENKRLREKAKYEFVEAVQKLAVWLKKRDPRYRRHLEQQKSIQEHKEKERKRRVAEQRAAVIESANSYVRQAWEEVDDTKYLEDYLSEYSASDLDDDAVDNTASHEALNGVDEFNELDPMDALSCFICDKIFKSAAQKANHEKSKKHQKVAREIRREMLREERRMAKMDGYHDERSVEAADLKVPDLQAEIAEAYSSTITDQSLDDLSLDEGKPEDAALAQMIDTLSTSQTKKSKKTKKNRQQQQQESDIFQEGNTAADMPLPEEAPVSGTNNTSIQASTADTSGDDTAQRKSKKTLRRERQKNRLQNENTCNVCCKEFTTRNQLFNHIKDTGHALANKIPKNLAEQFAQQRPSKSRQGNKDKKH
ncbi:hypothetical protein GGI26_001702 [Coemansia sp. RSA 1358]|uniref:DnaJ-domain-containing protein n=1 Tax=Coemansia umbellata TaxID=1424467 RepID=A0ABQ8PVS9_9FUNG|nr:hypothetical protein EDC05_000300 [Coemansia umbellata]KAJ2624127.1 hypothetical protein GGI26_001702 [Coemansia sp. RSA 1358]